MKLVYVAGPYRAKTREACERNIQAALNVARLCAAQGWMPVTPHSLTPLFDWDYPGLQDDAFWLAGTMEVLRRCDAMILCPGWEYSVGTTHEVTEAGQLGIPIFHNVKDLADALHT